MIGLLSACGGLAGVAGIAAWFLVPGLSAALSRLAKAMPPKAWLAIAIVVTIGVAVWLHQVRAAQVIAQVRKDTIAARDKQWQVQFDKLHGAALTWKSNYQGKADALAMERQERHEQDLRDIAARADALGLRGPGKAAAPACGRPGNGSGSSAAAGQGSVAPGRTIDGGVAGMPGGEGLAIVPWADLVGFARFYDANRAEVIAWREDRAAQVKLRDEAVKAIPALVAPGK